jgi:hypothetical protein
MADKLVKVEIKTLAGIALDWVIAKCEGWTLYEDGNLNGSIYRGWHASGGTDLNNWRPLATLNFSTDRERSGFIAERELISVMYDPGGDWIATKAGVDYDELEDEDYPFGATPSLAAMRCFAMAKLGATVEVPEQLLILSAADTEVESSMSAGDKHGG